MFGNLKDKVKINKKPDLSAAKEVAKKVSDGGPSKGLIILIVIVAIIVAAFLLAINFITEWLWFKEVGYVSVFIAKIVTQLKYGIPIAAILALLMGLYLHGLKRAYFKNIKSKEETNIKRLNLYTNLISIVFGVFIAVYIVREMWFELLEFINSTSVGIKDPLFNLDVSFYLFRFQFLNQLNSLLIGIVALFFGATFVYYTILMVMHSPDTYEEDEAIPVEEAEDPKVIHLFGKKSNKTVPKQVSNTNLSELLGFGKVQLTILGAVLFAMVGIKFVLMQFDLLHAHSGVVYGAGYTDVKVILTMYRILIGLAIVGIVASILFIPKGKFKMIAAVPIAMVVVFALGLGLGELVQNMIVAPDEINKESKYLANNIEFTQYAYDIDKVDIRDFAANTSLDADAINANDETISNLRINDFQPVQTFYNQTQSIRQYYTFNDTDVDRYILGGDYTQTYLSVREIDESKINDTWINRHIKYTHGYGAVVSRVDTITASGQPDVILKDIPPVSPIEDLTITRPEIYFGESTDDYIIVGTNEEEFDYPDGQENRYTTYEGTAGIKMSFLNRLMFAIRERSMKLLVSTNVNSNSRIIINREITHRIARIMPFLAYEDDPYAVTVDGKIYWVSDAYTTSSYYPYSEPYTGQLGGTNYIRNSIKIVVDAYNGTVDFYIVDPEDPIALTYQKIFPKLFKNFDEMPEGIRAHIRYPHALFQIQADVYGRYHMNDVKVFYQDEDNWDVAHEIYGVEEAKIRSNYFVLKLPGEKSAEFVSALPFSPKGKQNMTAMLVNRNDGEHYGELVLYRFPKSKTIYGPMQIEAQIDQNTKISQDFSLWSNAGSKYSRGSLFVIPIEDSLLYIEPIYLEASNTAIPEVKRIIVAYGDRIAYEPTLREALVSLFGKEVSETGSAVVDDGSGDTSEIDGSGIMSQEQLIQQATQAYENAQAALKEGDWSAYGRYMEELENALNSLGGGTMKVTDSAADVMQPADQIDADASNPDGEGTDTTETTEEAEEIEEDIAA